jgi:hypothetical protein
MTRRRTTIGGEPSDLDRAAAVLFARVARRRTAEDTATEMPARPAPIPQGAREEGRRPPDDPLRSILADLRWMDRAACRGAPTSWFVGTVAALHRGAAVCGACPVRAECGAYGSRVARPSDWGQVWGGTIIVATYRSR